MSQVATPMFVRSDQAILGGAALAVVMAGTTRYLGGGAVLAFACSAIAIALLASLVGRSVEQLGDRLGAGATGVLQSALGNLPELFIALFALKAGLVAVVQAALIGSILANLLLVMGAGVPRRRVEAWPPEARLQARPRHDRPDGAVGRGDGAAVAGLLRACPARPNTRTRCR